MYPAFPANGAAGPAVVAAAADIGSNTIKMSVATLTQSGVLPELATCSETVRLGTGPTTSGILAEDRMETALALLLGLLPATLRDRRKSRPGGRAWQTSTSSLMPITVPRWRR